MNGLGETKMGSQRRAQEQIGDATNDLHSSEDPESKHEAILLVEHVDRLRNALLPLRTGVDVEPGREDHEGNVLDGKENSKSA